MGSSRSALLSSHLVLEPILEPTPFAAALLRFERFGYALARTISQRNLPYMLMRQPEPFRDGGTEAPHWVGKKELDWHRRRIHGVVQPQKEQYEQVRTVSTTKTKLHVSADLRPEIAQALRAARRALDYTQTELAQVLGCSQDAVSMWERKPKPGRREVVPPVAALTLLARLVPEDQKSFWIEAGAIPDSEPLDMDARAIPVLHDAAAAGTPRALNEREIDFQLSLPRQLLPHGGRLVGVRVKGDSMSPVLEEGYIAIVDVTQRRMEDLVGKMVAARDRTGVTLKWLRKGRKLFMLVPQNTSQRHDIQVIEADGEWSIVGEVVKWIGEPHPPRGK